MTILIVGDSHAYKIKLEKEHNVTIFHGASAKGLNNINSLSKTHDRLLKLLFYERYETIILNFGNVDITHGYIYNYCKNNNTNFEDYCHDVIENYLNFIITNMHEYKIIILSAGLPVLDDANLIEQLLIGYHGLCFNGLILDNDELNRIRNLLSSSILPDIKTRTKYILYFNNKLQKEIIKLNNINISYLDVTSFTYDTDTEIIHEQFFTKNELHNFERNEKISEIINNYL